MLKHYYILFIILLILQSCDSGTSSGDNSLAATEYQFNLNAQIANQCGHLASFSQLEVHLQDDNWQLIEKYSANTNGLVSFITEQKQINYTIVAKYQQGDKEEGLDIISYFQAETTTPASYLATFDSLLDNSSCECVVQDIELQHRSFSSIDSISTSFNHDNIVSINSGKTHFSNAEVCRKVDEEWPVQSIAMRGLDANDNAIGVASLLENFSSNTENLWQMAAVEVADSISLSEDHSIFEIVQTFKNGEHFYNKIDADDSQLLVFKSHPYISEAIYSSLASHTFESIDTIFGLSTFTSHHQFKSTIFDETLNFLVEVEQPNIDSINFSELAADGSYDYSVVSGYSVVKIVFNYQTTGTSLPTNWTMYGPLKGTLASSVQLSGYEGIIEPDSYISSSEIKIIKSSNSDNYTDYISYYQGNVSSDLADDLNYFQLRLVL